jgi:CubicO group peptidase (beta-lactamase class C family)
MFAVLIVLIALALAPAAGAAPPHPGVAWQKVAPATVGLDAARLNDIAAQARGGRSSCLVVVRDGKLAGEWYFGGTGPNTAQDVYSATKSVA